MSAAFPPSFDMTRKQPAAKATGLMTRFRSDNEKYNAGDILRFEIPCSGRGQYLLPNDSFISFDYTSKHTATGGNLRLDGSVYSMIKRIRIIHGSQQVFDLNNAGRLFSALYDVQVAASARAVDTIRLGVDLDATTQSSPSGFAAGQQLVSDTVYSASFTLPIPILGALSKSAIPLGAMASSLFLEIEIAPHKEIVTTREFTNMDGSGGTVTTLALTSFTVQNAYYNAKISTVDAAYDAALMAAFGQAGGIVLPAYDWISEAKVIPAGTIINEKLSFSRSSCIGWLWFLTNADAAVGKELSTNLAEPVNNRQAGALKQYYAAISGVNMQPVYTTGSTVSGYFNGANAIMNLGRIFDTGADTAGMGIVNFANYCNTTDTHADAMLKTKRFVGAFSLEAYDANSKYQCGMSLIGQDSRLYVETTTTVPNILYAYCMSDVGYALVDGQLQLWA